MAPRRPRAALAAIAGLVSPGLGYLYVGRLWLALAVPAVLIGTAALAGWTRSVMEPLGMYAAAAVIALLRLISIVHPATIAYRLGELPARSFNRWWVYLIWIAAIGVVNYHASENRGALFGFEPFRIPASSMSPILERNDFIMVDTWYFERRSPAINDLVVHDLPADRNVKYVKRVVGLPGDSLEMRDNVLFRNGQAVSEPFVRISTAQRGPLSDFAPIDVPDDHYYVLGDNRHNSRDSRFIGPIHRDLLYGRVEYRWFAYADGIRWSRFPARLSVDGGEE